MSLKIKALSLALLCTACATPAPKAAGSPPATPSATSEADDSKFTDESNTLTVPTQPSWTMRQEAGGVVAVDVDGQLTLFLTRRDGDDATQAIADAWGALGVTPPRVDDTNSIPGDHLWERSVVVRYEQVASTFVQAIGRVRDGNVYVALIRGDLATLQKRSAQVNIIVQGLKPIGIERLDLSRAKAELTDEEIAQWAEFAQAQFDASQVPGAAVVLIRDGEVVWKQAFGVTRLGSDEAMTTTTPMMIGSTTKPLTTLVLAALVDAGKLQWEQSVQEIVPQFRMQDLERSKQVQVQHLACACTGVPRRDLELFFENSPKTGEDMVHQLKSFQLLTGFGETFQYSNQMVAMAGFTAAVADGGRWGQLDESYRAMMQRRLLDPLGMSQTSLDFDRMASSSRARPHVRDLSGAYVPLDISKERFVMPVAPAGAMWSTVEDLAKLAQVLLDAGRLPDGSQLVSAAGLRRLWTQLVKLSPTLGYGLGWYLEDFHGVRMVRHGGNNFGFTSGFMLVPEAKIGVIVLSNGASSNRLASMLDARLMELLYDQPARTPELAAVGWERAARSRAKAAEQVGPVDMKTARPFLGAWENEALGTIHLREAEGALVLDGGTMSSKLGRALKGPYAEHGYLLTQGPLMMLPLRLREVESTLQVVLGEGEMEYIFVRD